VPATATDADASATWRALGTLVQLVVTEPGSLPGARRLLDDDLAAVDAACSRFRADSELRSLAAGRNTISPLLAEAVAVALRAARLTGGDVDPTVGAAMSAAGYDRDFQQIEPNGPPLRLTVRQVPGWREVRLDGRFLTLPEGVQLDLGATAKAWAADRSAARIATRTGCGVLVSLGGDIATAGPAPDGTPDTPGAWEVAIQDRPGDADATATSVTLPAGSALATSSTNSRTWQAASGTLHHILDPRSLRPAVPVWRYVSVAARRCVDANTASTAALVRGHAAAAWPSEVGLAARLVAADGQVVRVGGWPRGPEEDLR
jgi:thiamine biosynthesis lipoprotein